MGNIGWNFVGINGFSERTQPRKIQGEHWLQGRQHNISMNLGKQVTMEEQVAGILNILLVS
ncbi:MAG TPA: hypothetical protein DCG77_02695 [Sphingobacterium sp.]|nr:hypothetical protein [Sphingobacterium sp.]HBI88461.1 hypothetical protein [Sphingobacterium sp.]